MNQLERAGVVRRKTCLPSLYHVLLDEYHSVGRDCLCHDRESDRNCGRAYEASDWGYLPDFSQEFRHGGWGMMCTSAGWKQ